MARRHSIAQVINFCSELKCDPGANTSLIHIFEQLAYIDQAGGIAHK